MLPSDCGSLKHAKTHQRKCYTCLQHQIVGYVSFLILRFRVRNGRGDIVGHVSVNPEEAADLQRHWLGSAPAPRATAGVPTPAAPTAPATKPNSAVAALVAAHKRHGAPRAATTGQKENPAVAAMLKAARKQGPATREAILRGC